MKKVNFIFCFAFAIAASFFLMGCNSTDPVAYNNELMTLMNENDKDMNAMNTAMASQDYVKAETVRKTWEENLDKAIAKTAKMETMKDDEGLKTTIEEGLKGYKMIAADNYKQLLEWRIKEKNGDASVQPQIQSLLDKINKTFDEVGTKVNNASGAFEKKYAKG